MPSLKIHCYLDRLHFGKVYWRVHHEIDWPVFYVKRNHRIYFHDVQSIYAIATKEYPGDPNAISSGLQHLQVDEACTRNPMYRKQLEFLADQDVKKRKKNRKRKSKRPIPKDVKKDMEFFSKILEIQKLDKAMRS